MKIHYQKSRERTNPNIKYKSSASFLYQKFLSIDKRMRKNIVIGASMITIVLVTGFFLAMIGLVQFGGSLIDDAFGEGKNVEKIILHADETL
jgi:hypothetical protein